GATPACRAPGASTTTVRSSTPCGETRNAAPGMTRVLPRVEGAVAAVLRALPDVRGKATVALGWKRLRERRGPLDGGWRLPLADGSRAVLPRGSAMTWAVAATGGWDRHVIDRLPGYIAPATVALDIGASI